MPSEDEPYIDLLSYISQIHKVDFILNSGIVCDATKVCSESTCGTGQECLAVVQGTGCTARCVCASEDLCRDHSCGNGQECVAVVQGTGCTARCVCAVEDICRDRECGSSERCLVSSECVASCISDLPSCDELLLNFCGPGFPPCDDGQECRSIVDECIAMIDLDRCEATNM